MRVPGAQGRCPAPAPAPARAPPFPPPATHVVCGMVKRVVEGGDLVVGDVVEVDAAASMKVLLPARAVSPNHSPTPLVGRMAGVREGWGGAVEVERSEWNAVMEEAEAPREFVGSREAEEEVEAEAMREAELATAARRRNCVDGGSGGGTTNCDRFRDKDQLCPTPPFFDPRNPHPWGEFLKSQCHSIFSTQDQYK